MEWVNSSGQSIMGASSLYFIVSQGSLTQLDENGVARKAIGQLQLHICTAAWFEKADVSLAILSGCVCVLLSVYVYVSVHVCVCVCVCVCVYTCIRQPDML